MSRRAYCDGVNHSEPVGEDWFGWAIDQFQSPFVLHLDPLVDKIPESPE
jgi:hypothetical protein